MIRLFSEGNKLRVSQKTNVGPFKFFSLVVFHVLHNSKLVLLLAMKPNLVGQQQSRRVRFLVLTHY